MKKKLLAVIASFLTLSSLSYSKNQDSADQVSAEQVSMMMSQIKELKAEVETLKKNNDSTTSAFSTYSSNVEPNNGRGDIVIGGTNINSKDNKNYDKDDIWENAESINGIVNSNGGIDFGDATPITTQGEVTYLGAYSGNNSLPIGMLSSNLFASTLLGKRSNFDDYSIFFGGFLQADAQVWSGSQITTTAKQNRPVNGQNIYLTGAKLYFLSNLGHYVTAQFDFDTDETNNFKLGNAFVIFGNLDTSPFFVTAGRNKLSIGSYGGGGPWTSGITKAMFAPKNVSNVSVNYKDEISNFNVSVFGNPNNHADFSTAYFLAKPINENLSLGFNAGYIYDLLGAGNANFKNGIKDNSHIGEINIDTNIAITNVLPGIWQIGAGWAQTTNKSREFNGMSNSYAGAWTVQSAYAQVLAGKKTNFNFSYGQSYNANNIPMALSSPAIGDKAISGISNQFIASAQRSYFDNNVLFGPEYSYQKLYNYQHMNTVSLDMVVYI